MSNAKQLESVLAYRPEGPALMVYRLYDRATDKCLGVNGSWVSPPNGRVFPTASALKAHLRWKTYPDTVEVVGYIPDCWDTIDEFLARRD